MYQIVNISWGLFADPWDDRASNGVIPPSCSQKGSFVSLLFSKSPRGQVKLALTYTMLLSDTDTDIHTDTDTDKDTDGQFQNSCENR